MISVFATIFKAVLLSVLLWGPAAAGDDPWLQPGADGRPQLQLYFFWSAGCPHCQEARPFVEAIPQRRPWGGSIDAAALSLPALTLMLAGLDAFNPCAFFVLLFLLSMMAHQKSRGRMLAVGGIFVLFSGLMYFAFMAAWLNVFQLLGQLAWVTAAAGFVAVGVGAINVKDFFAFKQGVSLSISDAGRADIFRRARAILAADKLPAVLAATVLLAIAANFYELLCTAGFPMVYARLLTLHEPAAAGRYLYLALYNLIYVLPLAAIVIVFARTLGARKLDERQGRLLKLLSGLMMLGLGLLLLVAPERTASASTGFALIAGALAVTWIAARLTRPQ
jgi:cytochrome c biogenesis protein CcdA